MHSDEKLRNLARNLAVLCRSFGSVSEVCRRTGINRQQFNKYLAGKHHPSPVVLAKISQFFSLDEEDLFKNPVQFDAVFEGPRFDLAWEMRSSDIFRRFLPLIPSSGASLAPYYGVYYRYHNSSIHHGRVLRSLVIFYENNSIVQYTCIERFPKLDGSTGLDCMFKYHGIAVMIEKRIFMADFESLQRNEITYSILLPKYRNSITFLYGVLAGVAATPLREPFVTRMALEYLGPGKFRKDQLKLATTLLPSDQSIPVEIRDYLTEPTQPIIRGR